MAGTVDLKELILGFESQGDESQTYVHRETGEVFVLDDDLRRMVEEEASPEDLPQWQRADWDIAVAIVEGAEWLRAPSKFDIHEWQIMQDFARTVRSDRVRDELEDAIHGRGAFRAFKGVLAHHRMFDPWNAFREAALREIAVDWCEENGLAWRE